MTMHQLHYTSCEDGLEGIQGFQISAMTPGAPKPLVELAVRASAYEVAPGLLGQADDGDLASFPVAFGYVPSGPAAALFQSRYTGSDFTGRTGNYFAHALLLDDVREQLRGALPIDMWRSPDWVHTRHNGTALPPLDTIAPGGATTPASVRRFLAEPGHLDGLARMVSAVQRVLAADRGRVVLVIPDDQTAALWLSALCRSFPRALGLGISFLTYTSRPEDAGVLVSCTTPDVHLPTYGDFTVVDMTAGAAAATAAEGATRYAGLLTRLWAAGDVASALLPAERVSPPLSASELDAFAVLVECADEEATPSNTAEPLVLDAVGLAVERAPGLLTEAGWSRIAGLLRESGGPVDLTRWSDLLQEAMRRRLPISADLVSTYYLGALGAPQRLWLPPLDDTRLEHVATHAVLPAITGSDSGPIIDRLAEHTELCDATARALERRLADPDELVPLVTTLAPRAATALRKRHLSPTVAALTDLVLARAGEQDRVDALSRVVTETRLDRTALGELLWPDEPSAQESVRALRALPVEVLAGTRLLDRIVAQAQRQIERDDLGPEHVRLVDALLAPGLATYLGPANVAVLKAAKFIGHFRQATPKREADRTVRDSLELYRMLPPNAASRLLDSLAGFLLRADADRHRRLLETTLAVCGRGFLTAYGEKARVKLATASPNHVAPVIVVWWSLTDTRARKQLIDETLPAALTRRRAKHLDQIGDLLRPEANKLAVDVPVPGKSWTTWWRNWRSDHQRKSLWSRLGLGRKH